MDEPTAIPEKNGTRRLRTLRSAHPDGMAPAKNLQPRAGENAEVRRIRDEIGALTMHLHWNGPIVTEVILGLLPRDLDDRPCRLLDLGCGNGEFARRFLERSPSWQAVCLNVLETHLELARRRLEPYGDRAAFVARAVEDLPTAEGLGSFSLITATALLHFIDDADLDPVIAAVHRLLAPGGLFLATQYVAYPAPLASRYQHGNAGFQAQVQPQGELKEKVDALKQRQRELQVPGEAVGHQYRNVLHSPERLMLACQRAGFATVDQPWRLYGMVMVAGLRG